MDNSAQYINILIDSLKKKKEILNKIKAANENQRQIVSADSLDEEAFDRSLSEKDGLIAEINELDRGFDAIYNRVREELSANKELYRSQITVLKGLISDITGLGMDIQAEEQRNSELVSKCLMGMRKKVSGARENNRVANSYYQNMSRTAYMEPQFLDRKK